MDFLQEITNIVSNAPTSVVYHLLVLFSLELALMMAFNFWRHTHQSGSGRLLLGTATLLGLRALMAAVALLAGIVFLTNQLVPVLDRAVTVATMMLIGWAIFQQEPRRVFDVLLIGGAIGLAIGALVAVYVWAGVDTDRFVYNHGPDDSVWQGVFIAIALAAILLLVVRRPPDWHLAAGMYVLWLAAAVAQVAISLTEYRFVSNIDGLRRLAELAIMPMFTGIVFRLTLRNAAPVLNVVTPTRDLNPADVPDPGIDIETERELAELDAMVPHPSVSIVKQPPRRVALTKEAARALSTMGLQADTTETVMVATEGVARAMLADVALMWQPPGPDGKLVCAGGYDLIRESRLNPWSIQASELPTVVRSLTEARPALLHSLADQPELLTLSVAMNFPNAGPAFIVPFFREGSTMGGIMVFSPHSQRNWEQEEQRLLIDLARPIAAAIMGAEARKANADAIASLKAQIASAEQQQRTIREEADTLRAAIDQARTREADYEQQLAAQTIADGAASPDAGGQSDELKALRSQLREAEAARDALQARLNNLPDHSTRIDAMNARLNLLQAERDDLADKHQALAEQHSLATLSLEQTQTAWDEERAKLNAQLEHLSAALSTARAAAGEPGSPDRGAYVVLAQELRAPLNSMLRYTQQLLDSPAGQSGDRKYVERIKANVDRMHLLLDSITSETTRPSLKLGPVDLLSVMDEAFMQFAVRAGDKQISLQMDTVPEVGMPDVQADPKALHEVLDVLLENAFANAPAGGSVTLNARLNRSRDNTEPPVVQLSVRDSGPAIVNIDQPRVFAKNGAEQGPPIGGLGVAPTRMADARALIEQMGGRLWLESDGANGNTFCALLSVPEDIETPA